MTNLNAITNDLMTKTNEEIIRKLMEGNILRQTMKCNACLTEMNLRKTKQRKDSFEWRCINYSCIRYQTIKSIRKSSKFETINCELRDILQFIKYWCADLQICQMLKLMKISKPTIIKLKNIIISQIKLFFELNPISLGGPLSICQIDETKLNFNVKSHRGRSAIQASWCLCIVDCSTTPALGYCKLVENRSSATLLPIIDSVVKRGTTIFTDEWPSYHALASNPNYFHSTVCHKYNFVCPQTGVHTQQVESYNNKIKLGIKKMKGLTQTGRENYLIEFMWKERNLCGRFVKLMELLNIN